MYRKACPIALCALTVALVVSRRRLNEAQAELRLLYVAARAHGDHPYGRIAQNAELTPREEETKSRAQAGVCAPRAGDDFAEWEQAVPPMDS
jgi:hypothetical protein